MSTHELASKYLNDLQKSQDRLDTIAKHFGTLSIDFKEALEEHMELRRQIHDLIFIGLEHKE